MKKENAKRFLALRIVNMSFGLYLVFLMTSCHCTESTAKIYEYNAVLRERKPVDKDTFSLAMADKEVEKYWGEKEKEKRYIIPFWQADVLIEGNPLTRLALRVTNIDNHNLAAAKWVAYDTEPIAALCEDENVSYYVIESQRYPDVTNKNLKSHKEFYNWLIIARIGEDEEGEKSVFFLVSAMDFEKTPPIGSDGPNGSTTGVRVP